MQRIKTWLILGANEGLGPAAVKYLSAHGQYILSVDSVEGAIALPELSLRRHRLDYIINNSNYKLFQADAPDIEASAHATICLLISLAGLLKQKPQGCIINIPPQLCLLTLDDDSVRADLQRRMDMFLHLIRDGLAPLGFPVRLIEPGERLF